MTMRFITPAIAAIGLTACGDAPPAQLPAGPAFDADRTVSLELLDTVLVHDSPLYRIGESPTDSVVFVRVSDINVQYPSGDIAVADREERLALIADSDGGIDALHNREGGGPGDLQAPVSVAVAPDTESLFVMDDRLFRITEFPIGGEESDAVVYTLDWLLGDGMRWRGMLQRIRMRHEQLILELRSDPLRVQPDSQRAYLVALNLGAERSDTVLSYRMPGWVGKSRETETSRGASWDRPPVFTPERYWAVAPSGLLGIADGEDGSIYLFDDNRVVRITTDYERAPIAMSDRWAFLDFERGRARNTVGPPITTRVLERMTRDRFAAVGPVFVNMIPAGSDQFLVQIFSTEDDPLGRSRTWILVNTEGRGRAFRFPPDFQPAALTATSAIGVATDGLGRQWIQALPLSDELR